MSDVKTFLHVVYAGFGDAAVLEFAGPGEKRRLYLVDGGPISYVGAGKKPHKRIKKLTKPNLSRPYYQYLLYTLTRLGRIPNTTGIKLDGAVVTHPDADHLDGVERLFRLLLPKNYQEKPTDKEKRLICNGPVLLTKKFAQDTLSDFLLESKFEVSLSEDDILNAFGNEIKFKFRTSPGVLYRREKPSEREPFSEDSEREKLQGDEENSTPNKSSIILCTDKGAKICLPGDAYGCDIVHFLRKKGVKDLDIFKLPHHGSSDNSTLATALPPPWAIQNLALMLLLSISLRKDLNQIATYEKTDIKHLRTRLEEITNEDNVQRVADAFLKVLEAKNKLKAADLLDTMQELHTKVVNAIQEHGDKQNPCESLKCLEPLKDWDGLKKSVSSTVGSLATVAYWSSGAAKKRKVDKLNIVRELMGDGQIFKTFFKEKIGIDKFYESFHAKTYYVSTDGRYSHPSPQVINGIIKAAMKKPEQKPCQIVLTCGKALDAASLLDVNDANYKGWNKLVPIYYLKDNVSFKLDPEQDVNVAPEGTAKFDVDETVRASVAKQLDKNAGFTIPERSFVPELDKFYVKTNISQDKCLWLGVKDDETMFLAETSKILRVSNEPSVNGDLRMVTLKSDTDGGARRNVWLEKGKGGFYIKGKPDSDYLVEEGTKIKLSEKKSDGSLFSFENKYLAGAWGGESEVPLIDYLRSVGYEGDVKSIKVRDVLILLLGVPNVTNLVETFRKDFVGTVTMDQLVKLSASSVEMSPDCAVVLSHIEVVLPTPTFQFDSVDVTKLHIVVTEPFSPSPKLQMLISTNHSGVKFTVDESGLLKERIPSLDMFLNELEGVSKDHRDKMTIGTLLNRVIGFVSLESVTNCLPSQFLESGILTWSVDRSLSTVEYFRSPLAVEVVSGDFYVHIPQEKSIITFGRAITAEVSRMHVMVKEPRTYDSEILVECDACIASVSALITIACSHASSAEVIIAFPDAFSISEISKTLGLSGNIQDLSVPAMNKLIRNLKLSNPRVTVVQDVPNSKPTRLSCLSFDVLLDNWSSVLPSSFPTPSQSKASIHVSNPLSKNYQVGVEVDFKMPIVSSLDDESFLHAKLSVLPVGGSEQESPQGHVIGISLQPSSSPISVKAILDAVGGGDLGTAMASSCPCLSPLMEKVLIDDLSLEVNSHSKAIDSMTLSLVVPEWTIFEGKFGMYDVHFLIQYANRELYVKADAELFIFGKFLCRAAFSLPRPDVSGSLTFENTDSSFTLKEMIVGVGFEGVDDVPLVNKVLDVGVSKVDITCENKGESFKLTKTVVVVEKEALSIGDFKFFNIRLEVSYSNLPAKFPVTFSLQGFLNSKAFGYLSYNADQKELLGSYMFVGNSSTAECLNDLFSSEMENFSGGGAFDEIQGFYVQEAKVVASFPSNEEWKLKEFLLSIEGSLSLGPFKLKRLRFKYVKNQAEDLKHQASVLGHFQDDDHNLSFLVELACTSHESGDTSFKAKITPDAPGSLKLTSLLHLVDLAKPEIPQIDGAPQFLDIALEEASLQFKVSPFFIEKLDVVVTTSDSFTILQKPQIELKKARLEYHRDGTKEPPLTSVYIAGDVIIGGFLLDVRLTKEGKGGLLLEGRLEDSKHKNLDFEEAAKELSTDVVVSLPDNVSLSSFHFRLEKNEERQTISLKGTSQRNWSSDAGFTTVTVSELGGQLSFQKASMADVWSGFVCLSGKVDLFGSVAVDVQIYYDTQKEVIVSGTVNKPSEVDLDEVTQSLASSNSSWRNLVPSGVDSSLLSPQFDSAFIHINFAQRTLFLQGAVAGFGTGVLFVKKARIDENDDKSMHWGFMFGLRLGSDFRFGSLCKQLSPIDDVISVQQANLSVVSLKDVKVAEMREDISKFKGPLDPAKGKQDKLVAPFADLDIQSIQEEEVKRGVTVYAKLDFVSSKSKLMSNMSQIQQGQKAADVVLFAHISESISESKFMARIKEMKLFGGCLAFNDVTLLYQPCSHSTLSLSGSMNLRLTEDSKPFVVHGSLQISDTEANFSMELGGDPETISEPFGMFALSIEEAKLELAWHFDHEKPGTTFPDYRVSGVVRFFKPTSPTETQTVAAKLEGSILFQDGRPEVAMISLNPNNPLKVDDMFSTLFQEQWPTGYLEVSFKSGEVYCARSAVEINGKKYKEGFNASTEIQIFDYNFGVGVSIDSKGIAINGYSKFEIDLVVATLSGKDFGQDTGPEICISRYSGETKFELTTGVSVLQEKIGTCSVGYNVTEKCFLGDVTYKGELLGITNPSITFEWSKTAGFRIRNWPVLLHLKTLIDFAKSMEELSKMMGGPCEQLIGLAFDKVIKTKCRLKLSQVPVKDSPNQNAWLAFKLHGMLDIMIVTDEPSLTVDFPEMIVAIDKPQSQFKLSDLPEFLIKEILKNSLELVKQISTQPEQLTKFFAALGGITLSRKILSGLICRGVRSPNVTEPAERELDNMENEAENAESSLDTAVETLTEAVRTSASIASLASSAVGVFAEVTLVVAALAALIGFLAGIIRFFTGKTKQQKEAERRKKEAEEKKHKARKVVEDRLIVSGLSLVHNNQQEDEVRVSWNPLEKGIQYSVLVTCTDIGGKETTLLDRTTESSNVTFKGDAVKYNAKKFVVGVQASYTHSGETFKGKKEVISQEARVRLPAPSNVTIESKQNGKELHLTFSLVESATDYEAEVVSENDGIIGSATILQPPKTQEGRHTFLATELTGENPGKCKVRIRARREDSKQNDFANSTDLYRAESPSDISLSYEPESQHLTMKWNVRDAKGISSCLCEVVSVKSKSVVYSKAVAGPGANNSVADLNFHIDEITEKTQSPYYVRVCSLGGASSLASAFADGKEQMSFLPPVDGLTPSYDPETNQLTVSWVSIPEVTNYRVNIREKLSTSRVVASATVDGMKNSTVFEMKEVKLEAEELYEGAIVAAGLDTKHLPSAETVSATAFTQLPMPASIKQEFSFEKKQINVAFQPVSKAHMHLVEVFKETDPTQIAGKQIVSKVNENWPATVMRSFDLQQLKLNGGPYKSRVIARGSTTWINSSPCVTNTVLSSSQAPSDVALTYSEKTKSINVSFVSSSGEFTVGVVDTNHQSGMIGSQQVDVDASKLEAKKETGHRSLIEFVLDIEKEPQGAMYQAFAQNTGDAKHLPSEVVRSNEVRLLDPPKSVIQDYRSGVLTVVWTSVQFAVGYDIKVYNSKSGNTAKELRVAQGLSLAGDQLEKRFDVYSLTLESNGLYKTSVASLADDIDIGGATSTTETTIPSCMSPENVHMRYESTTHCLNVLCKPVSDAVLYKIGIVKDTPTRIPEEKTEDGVVDWKEVAVSPDDFSQLAEAHFDVSKLIPSFEVPYRGIAQVLENQGETPSLPSGFHISEVAIPWLEKPSSIKLSFDPEESILKTTWRPVYGALSYLVESLQIKKDGGTTVAYSAEAQSTSCDIDVSKVQVEDQDKFVARVRSIGDESVISFASLACSEDSVGCQNSPTDPEIHKLEDETVELRWKGTKDATFEVSVWRISEPRKKVVTKHTDKSAMTWSPAALGMDSPGQYHISVRAQGLLDKLPSRVSDFDFPVVIMEAPVVKVDEQSHALMVQWKPVDPHSAQNFSNYVISYQLRSTNEWKHVIVNLSESEKALSDLRPGEEYIFFISPANAERGNGIRSPPTVIRTNTDINPAGNLLENPDFRPAHFWDEDGFTKDIVTEPWQVVWQGGAGYRLERITQEPFTVPGNVLGGVVSPNPLWGDKWCVAASSSWCWRVQVIDLLSKGFSAQYLDHDKPVIHVHERFACRTVCGGECDFKVSLLGDDKKVIPGTDTSFYSGIIKLTPQADYANPQTWKIVEHSFSDFPPGVRFIRFEDGMRSRNAGLLPSYYVRAYAATVEISKSPDPLLPLSPPLPFPPLLPPSPSLPLPPLLPPSPSLPLPPWSSSLPPIGLVLSAGAATTTTRDQRTEDDMSKVRETERQS